nr:hypothetical protein [Tanacetum cinerariifolium]
MATTLKQQVALDEALVSSAQRLRIGRSNFRLPSDIQSKEPTLQVVYDVLCNSPFFKAFLVTADVLEIYMQDLWATAKLHQHSIRFKMGTRKHVLDLEAFREMLHISPRILGQSFAELPFKEEILEFLRDDILFSTIKVVSRHQDTQQYGAILSIELTTKDIRNTNAYKEYYACATGEAAPKPKASAKKKKRLSAAAKGKQPARATSPTDPSDVERTEAEQLKIVLRRSRQETHISQQRSSSTDEGTDVDEKINGRDAIEGEKTDESDDDNDDQQEDEKGNDNNDDEVTKSDEGEDDATKSDRESEDEETRVHVEESFDPIPQTPEESKDDDNNKEDQGLRIGEEERMHEEEEADELYSDVDINQGMDSVFTTSSSTVTPIPSPQSTMTPSIISTFTTASQLPTPPTSIPSLDLQNLPTFASVFRFEERVKTLEEEPVQTTCQMEEPSHPVFETGAEDQPIIQTSHHPEWFSQPSQQYQHNLLQPLSLIPDNQGRRVIPFEHFINNDLEYLRGGASSRKYTTSVTKTKAADYGHIKWIEELVPRAMRIIAVTNLKIVEWHDYKHLDWMSVRRDDDKIYKFKEGNFKRLCLQDIKDTLLLLVQGKLSNLTVEEGFAFNVSLMIFTRSIVIQRRVEDLQLGVESYQKRLNLTKTDTYRSVLKQREAYTAHSKPRGFIYQKKDKKNRLMRIDELHKFRDGTLNDVRNALDDRLKGIRMQAVAMIQAIDKMLKTRRIMRSLERITNLDGFEILDQGRELGFNSLVHSLHALSALRHSGLRMASTAAKPYQGDSLEFYLITGIIHIDQRGTVVLATLLNERESTSDDYPFDLTKPLPLVKIGNRQKTKAAQYDLPGIKDMAQNIWSPVKVAYDKHAFWGIFYWRDQRKSFYGYVRGLESTHDVYFTKCIMAVTQIEVMRKHGYGYLKEIVVRRADNDLYKFKEGDFLRLCINDNEDMLLLVFQNRLTDLLGDDDSHFIIALRMFTRSIVIQKRVEDLQLAVESYQIKINVTKSETTKLKIRKKDPYTPYQDLQGLIMLTTWGETG